MSLSYSDRKYIRDHAGKGSDNNAGCGVIIFYSSNVVVV